MMIEADTDVDDPRGDEDGDDDDTVVQLGDDSRHQSLSVAEVNLLDEKEEKQKEVVYTLEKDGVEYIASIENDGFQLIEGPEEPYQLISKSSKSSTSGSKSKLLFICSTII